MPPNFLSIMFISDKETWSYNLSLISSPVAFFVVLTRAVLIKKVFFLILFFRVFLNVEVRGTRLGQPGETERSSSEMLPQSAILGLRHDDLSIAGVIKKVSHPG